MLISVIIPCYNTEQYLPDCLNSLQNQTYPHWEAICIDDGSTDNTRELLKEFALQDNRIITISQKNSGVAAARNRALAECKGEYICFLDSDDTIKPNFLEALLTINSINNDLSICNFTRKQSSPSVPIPAEVKWRLTGYECAYKIMCDKSFHPQICCMLFKHKIIQQYHLTFSLGCARGEDWEFFMKYLVHCKYVAYSLAPLYHYRVNENSAMASFNEKSLTSLEASQRVSDYYELNQSPVKEAIKQYALPRSIWKFLILSLLLHNKVIYHILRTKYDTKKEIKKLYTFPGFIEKITSRLYVFSEPLFRFGFYLYGYYKKYKI